MVYGKRWFHSIEDKACYARLIFSCGFFTQKQISMQVQKLGMEWKGQEASLSIIGPQRTSATLTETAGHRGRLALGQK